MTKKFFKKKPRYFLNRICDEKKNYIHSTKEEKKEELNCW